MFGKVIPVQVPKEVPVISLDKDHTHIIILDKRETSIEVANELTKALSIRGIKVLVLIGKGKPSDQIAALELKVVQDPIYAVPPFKQS